MNYIPLQTNYQEYIEVRESSIHHKGVFAKKYIPKDGIIIEYTGEIIPNEEAERRELENNKRGLTYIFILDDQHCIDGAIAGNEAKYINHSCDPTCIPEIIDGRIWIIANRDIKPGEELTYDYEFPHDDPMRDKCCCASKNCRGFIQLSEPEKR